MTAEAPSAVSAGESPQSVMDTGLPSRPLLPAHGGPADGAGTPGTNGSFPYASNGVHTNGASPNGTGAPEDGLAPVEDRTGTAPPAPAPGENAVAEDAAEVGAAAELDPAEVDAARTEPADTVVEPDFGPAETAEPDVATAETAEPDFARAETVEPDFSRAGTAEPDFARAETFEPDFATAETAEPDFATAETVEPDVARAGTVEPDFARAETFELGTAEVDTVAPESEAEPVLVETATVDSVLAEPVDLTDGPDLSTEAVAAEVAGQLGSVVGDDGEADPAEFAAAAVLDVLRAAGWADAAEAAELRAEATRTRELLSEVIRDHRAREASAAGGQNQQLYWLIPLLRAAHGVAFGSLGAKVALRTAVQEVPPDVLASAGLRIDYGVEPAYED